MDLIMGILRCWWHRGHVPYTVYVAGKQARRCVRCGRNLRDEELP